MVGPAFHPDFGRSSGDSPARKALRDSYHQTSFREFDRVIYVPRHAQGDRTHKDCEHGVVSRRGVDNIFVKFDKQIKLLGFEEACAQSCCPEDLVHE